MNRVRELDRVTRPLDVGDPVRLRVGGHVVHRGEVEEVVDLAIELGDLGGPVAGRRPPRSPPSGGPPADAGATSADVAGAQRW
jgi:hypothetical protein